MAQGWDGNIGRDASSRRGSDEDDRDLGSDDIHSPDNVSSLLSPDKDPLNSNYPLFPNSVHPFMAQTEDEPLPQYNEQRNHTAGSLPWNPVRETLNTGCYNPFSPVPSKNTLLSSNLIGNLLGMGGKVQPALASTGGAIAKNSRNRGAFPLSLPKGNNRETLDDAPDFNAARGGARCFIQETLNEVKPPDSNKDVNFSSRRTSVSSEGQWNWNESVAMAPLSQTDRDNFLSDTVSIGCHPSTMFGNGIGLNNSNVATNGYSHSGNLPTAGLSNNLDEEFARKLNIVSPQHPGPGPIDPIGTMPRSVANNGFHGENGISHNPGLLSLTPQYNNTLSLGSLPGSVTPRHGTPNIDMRGGDLSGNHRLSINPSVPYTPSHPMNMSRGPVKHLDFGADEGPFMGQSSILSTSPFGDTPVSNFAVVSNPRNRELHISDAMFIPAMEPCMVCHKMVNEPGCSICLKPYCRICIYTHPCLGSQLNFNTDLSGPLPRMPLSVNSLASRHNNGNYPVQSPNQLATAAQPYPIPFRETFAPPAPQNGRSGTSPNKYCDTHPEYFVRFTTMNNTESACTVCLLKRIGGKLPKRFNKLIPMPNLDNSQYQELVNEFLIIVEKLPILITRYLGQSIDPFVIDNIYRHSVFITYNDLDEERYPLVSKMNHLVKHVNVMIRLFSNVDTNMLMNYISNVLSDMRELYEELWKHVECNGPSKIPLSAGTDDCGKGKYSFLTGPAMSGKIVKDRDTICYVVVRNQYDEPRESNRDALKFDIRSDPGGVAVRFNMSNAPLKGVYEVSFIIQHEGNYKIAATVNNELIRGSPHVILVTNDQINYNRFYEPKVHLGHGFLGPDVTVAESGFFNRPWGVHITHDGYILLADRSNHKVHVINPMYTYSHSIGGPGSTDGKFSRPSKAIEIRNQDGTRDVLVSDKDNNRLQILTWNGDFKRKTSDTEDLKYPWDVCLTEEGIILCTDSRKQRISCFNLHFQLVKVVSLPTGVSPRGICMGYLNHCIVTEFCNHDILILYAPSQKYVLNDPSVTCYRRYSMKTTQKTNYGSYQGHFDKRGGEKNQDRLQGVTMDQYGNILVCDSRQKKVRVVSYLGRPVAEWEIDGEPQGLAAVPDKVAVVNAEKNTLDIFF